MSWCEAASGKLLRCRRAGPLQSAVGSSQVPTRRHSSAGPKLSLGVSPP